MATWNDALIVYNGTTGALQKIASVDAVTMTGGFTAGSLTTAGALSAATGVFSSNVTIGGSLTVQGDIISASTKQVMLGDSFIDLLAESASVTPLSGGLTVNVFASSSAFTTGLFVAGVSTVSNPTVTTTSVPTGITANHIIQISGTPNGVNDGLYAVLSVAGSTITIKGVGNTDIDAQTPFLKRQFVAGTYAGSLVNANIAVWAVSNGSLKSDPSTSIGIGTWSYAYGANDTDFIDNWTGLTAVVQTLQGAYDGGATASIAMQGGRDLTVTAPGVGTAAISFNANKASNFTVAGDTLTLSATRIDLDNGNVSFASAGVVAMDTSLAAAAGEIVYRSSGGGVGLSDNDGSAPAKEVDGVVVDAPSASGYMAVVPGTRVQVKFVTGAEPTAEGQVVYLSSTPGAATRTIPTSGRVYRLGSVVSTTPAAGLYTVEWNPQYIVDLS